MKVSEIRELSSDEIRQHLQERVEELFNLRFQHGTDQLENSMRLRSTKREIARMKTILRQRDLAAPAAPEGK